MVSRTGCRESLVAQVLVLKRVTKRGFNRLVRLGHGIGRKWSRGLRRRAGEQRMRVMRMRGGSVWGNAAEIWMDGWLNTSNATCVMRMSGPIPRGV